MKFQQITLEETYDRYPYLLITYPTWSLEKVRIFYAIRLNENRLRNGFCYFHEYINGSFLKFRLLWRNNFDIYTLIPFHEELMLNRLLRHVTGDPTFYCDVLDHKVFITMRF
jgi:hypothetical protein